MEPDPLFERLQRALLPDYRLERELASGGMGRVFLAADVTLNSPVAVKVLRPELATAHAAEAFLREAHLLARVRHPHIVTIYHAGSGEGLQYYIMELVAGPTLQQLLEQRHLRTSEAVKLGRDLLDGLESVHRAGVVHRDVKPSNVFLVGEPPRGVLADFGIARPPSETRTPTGRTILSVEGTPGYMAPEQLSGGAITPATDLYSTGAVIYEAMTGRRFPPIGEKPSWQGIPQNVARVLRRATCDDPEMRWRDARTFRRALWRTRALRYLVWAGMLALGGIVIGSAVVLTTLAARQRQVRPGALAIALPAFEYIGPPSQRAIADSLVELLRAELRGHPDFYVTATRRWLFRSTPSLVIRGRVTIDVGVVRVHLADVRMRGTGTSMPDVHAPLAEWPSLRDSLAYRILLAAWDAKSPLAPSLPLRVLPRTAIGLARFLEAEQLVARGEWQNAYRAYALAEATDSTCRLCAWRLTEVERWLSRTHDPALVRRYLAHVDSFPPWYATLIRASQLPLPARLDTLRAETDRWGEFFLGWMQLGDELFHRGPLAGRRRAEAIPALEAAARRRPDFAPAWEHLAWVEIAEGDSGAAARALDSLDRRNAIDDPYALTLRSLLGVAFAFRFLPEPVARASLERALGSAAAGASPELGAGPRMLGSFDAPRGQIVFGEILAAAPTRDLQRSGLIAQIMGSLALGKPSRARALAQRLRAVSPQIELTLFAAELDATLTLLDPAAMRSAAQVTRERRDSTAGYDPFSRTVAHMLRAEQRVREGDLTAASRELLWHEHTDLVGLPTGLPQAAEVDWAFGTLARWRRATLPPAGADRADVCGAYRDVIRLWSAGEPLYQARADTARQRFADLRCP